MQASSALFGFAFFVEYLEYQHKHVTSLSRPPPPPNFRYAAKIDTKIGTKMETLES